jgi:hypothetical protein
VHNPIPGLKHEHKAKDRKKTFQLTAISFNLELWIFSYFARDQVVIPKGRKAQADRGSTNAIDNASLSPHRNDGECASSSDGTRTGGNFQNPAITATMLPKLIISVPL